MNERLDFNCEW